MTEAVLQILLLLAYLAIGLISVTFPIYAICVSYLRQEKWETTKELKKRSKELESSIARLTKELSGEKKDSERFTQIREELEKCESESKSLELRVEHLTAKGAVGRPVQYLVIALASVSAGIYCFYEGYKEAVAFFGFVSGLFSTFTIRNLYTTISAVEHAVLRPAHTVEFDVCYASRQKSETIKLGKETKFTIGIASMEEDVQNLQARIYIPPEIELKRVSPPAYFSLQAKEFAFPNHNMIMWERDYLHRNIYRGIGCRVLAKETGKHKIPVRITAKDSYAYETELILNVVK